MLLFIRPALLLVPGLATQKLVWCMHCKQCGSIQQSLTLVNVQAGEPGS